MDKEYSEYQTRLNRFNDVLNNRLPDRVPLLSMATTWIFHYSGIPLKQIAQDMYKNQGELLYKAYEFFFSHFHCDAIQSMLSPNWCGITSYLGKGFYELTDESIVSNQMDELLYENEYDDFSKNPIDFIANTILPRKYPLLREKNNFDALSAYYKDLNSFSKNMENCLNKINQNCGVALLRIKKCQVAPDIMADFLRNIYGFSIDIKRSPLKYKQACYKIQSWMFDLLKDSAPVKGRTMLATLHTGTYLNPKDFGEFYFPYMKLHAETLTKLGYSITYFMEGNWEPYIDYFEQLPDKNIICLFEYGDLKRIKRKLKNRIVIAGGMPLSMLGYSSKQECLDYAKKLIDELAYDGRYIFATDKSLISKDDVKAENYFDTYNFVYEYGKY